MARIADGYERAERNRFEALRSKDKSKSKSTGEGGKAHEAQPGKVGNAKNVDKAGDAGGLGKIAKKGGLHKILQGLGGKAKSTGGYRGAYQ